MANFEPTDALPAWDAQLLAIFISGGHDYWGRRGEGRLQHGIESVRSVEAVADRGLMGDRYFDSKPGHKGQVTFFDADVVEAVREKFRLPQLPASVFRRNLIVRGVRLADWLGRRFVFQGVVFEGSQECTPCHWMDRSVDDGTQAFLAEHFRGGLRARVVMGGTLRVNGESD